MTRFTDAMWAEIRPTYEAILDLPFNRELAAGTLSRERFVFYMVQDAHYLGAFARALATAAAKAITPEAQVTFAKSAHEAIVVERALHEGFFREFGVSAERFAATRPSPTALSGISCVSGHDGSKGAPTCRDAKRRRYLTPFWTSCWRAPIPRRRSIRTASSTA